VGDSTYTNVAVSTRENIGIENNIGLSLFANINFTKKFTIRTNVFAFHRHTINAVVPGQNSTSFNYRFNMNASYQFAKTLAGEFFGNFNSARHEAQGISPLLQLIVLPLESRSGRRKEALPLRQIIHLINMLIEKLLYLARDLLLIAFKEYLSDPLELISPGSLAALNLKSLKKTTRLI
jgi:hypothetical protein